MTSIRQALLASTSRLERQGDNRQSPGSSQSFGLTFSRGWLVHVANETVKISQEGLYLNRQGEEVHVAEALRHSVENSVHYHSSHIFNPSQTTQHKFHDTSYQVQYGSSLEVASRLRGKLSSLSSPEELSDVHIGILNSASGKHPDKFLRGTISQEEGICRASLLYPCLLQYSNRPHHFYYINRTPKYQDTTSSCAIFSPRVPVIREDSLKGQLLDNYETCSFVSIPAPNAFALGSGGLDEKDEEVVPRAQAPGSSEPYEVMSIRSAMHDRIFRALSIFAEQGCTDLVLCAFGCGAHGNDPKKIATCFRDVLSNELNGRFRTVVFAINPSRYQNFEEFVQVFGDEADEPTPSS
jgi:uncharacterized protein (TIGR02452 family)